MPTLAMLILLLSASGLVATAQATPSASDLVDRSIRYHDPEQTWSTHAIEFTIEVGLSERLAKGRGYASRIDRIFVDNASGRFRYATERGETRFEIHCDGAAFTASLNGSSQLSDADREKHRLTEERLPGYRDYFTYLLGMPMKLRDPGTVIDPDVKESEFNGRSVLVLKVTYDPEVGGDTWYFNFDPETFALVGYRFYHDESKNDGEYITFEGEVEGPNGLRLPKRRAWYTNKEREYLAVDDVLSITESVQD